MKDEKLNELAEQHLVKLMREEPTTVLMWSVIQAGKIVVETNAANLKLETESTLNGKRYRVTNVTKVKLIKP